MGEVLLKTDPRWAEFHNARDIGGFGVPWGPYGFNSGVTQEDVSKAEALQHGLTLPDQTPEEKKIDDDLWASVRNIDPAIKAKLIAELEAGPKPSDIGAVARAAAADTRRTMLHRGLASAEGRGDASQAGKYRQALAELHDPRLTVRDGGDKIALEKPDGFAILPRTSHEIHPQPASGKNPAPPIGNIGGQDGPAANVTARIGRASQRNPQQGREAVVEKIRREREALEQLAAQEPDITIPFHAVSDIRETNEHNIRIAPDGRFWKYTKGEQYGYLPTETYPDLHDLSKVALGIEPASPTQYLERIRLHNRLFGDDVKIEGISSTGGLVISQRPIQGREATEAEIASALADAGWVKVPSGRQALPDILKDTAWYDRETQTVMLDARPANVLVDREGRLHMIDVMLKTAAETLLALLETL